MSVGVANTYYYGNPNFHNGPSLYSSHSGYTYGDCGLPVFPTCPSMFLDHDCFGFKPPPAKRN